MLETVLIGAVVAGAIFVYLKWRARRESAQTPTYNFLPVSTPSNGKLAGDDSEEGTPGETENFVTKMKASKKSMVVFYGSQTGTAEGFAYRLAKDARRYGIGALVLDPEGCPFEALAQLKTIENPLVVYCMATYGEGDPTDNAQELVEWLQRSDPDVDLAGISFAVFGLGNKSYEHFNEIGKIVDKQMELLHAERVLELGQGDDDANIEDDFVVWSDRFWTAVCYKFNISPNANSEDSSRQYKLVEYEDQEKVPANLFTGEPARLKSFEVQKPPFDAKNPYLATITAKRELHKGGGRSCLHVEVDISGSRLRYDAGDHMAIVPENNTELVAALGKRLGADLDRAFLMENVDPEAAKRHPFPCPTTYRTALTHYLDITASPRTNVLRELAAYTTDEKEKEFLSLLSSPSDEGRAKYAEWVLDCCRDLLAVLEDLPNLNPPIDLICELLPRLQPRYYSISSSPKVHPTAVHITAVVVEYKTKTGRQALGVCTNFIKNKAVGEKVPVFIRRSQFRLPFRPSVPVIMIGPGTGLAPFRGFIQDRWYAGKKENKPVGETVLFFGCRKRADDYIYEEELTEWRNDGTLTQLHVAFSRDKATKTYVQHMIRENANEMWRLIDSGHAHIYVCGDASHMAADVQSAFIDICTEHGKMNHTAATDYMKKLSKQGRYSADVWS